MNKGYTKSETVLIKRKDRTDKVITTTKWTQKGRLKINQVLNNLGIAANIDKERVYYMKQCYTVPFKPDTVNKHWITIRGGTKTLSREGRDFRNNVQNHLKCFYKPYKFSGDIKVKLNLYFKDKRKRDIDNYFKAIFDSFNGVLYEDDS